MAKTKSDASASRVVRLLPWPKAVRVSLNGKLLGEYGSDVVSVVLPRGPSELVFENPGCYAERVHIAEAEDPGEVHVRLRWKPALLLVRAALPDAPAEQAPADVVVDGRIVGSAGQVMALPIPARSDDGRATVEVKVSAPGRRTVTHKVQVRANQLTTLEAPLSPGS